MPQRKKYNDVIGEFTALIVEDEAMVALDIELLLKSLGAVDVETVSESKAALELLGKRKFDLCLIDYHLDDGTSNRTAQRVIEMKVPHIFMTGDRAFAEKLGADERINFLEKPFSHHDVKVAVAHVLGTKLPESAQDFIDKQARSDF